MEMHPLELGSQVGALFVFVVEFFCFSRLLPVVCCTGYELFFGTLWVFGGKALSFDA